MKTFHIQSKGCIAGIMMIISISSFAQKSITWKGGTLGMETEWFCPQNWSTSSVPDEFSNVIIPDVSTSSFSLPVISSGQVEINSLVILYNGSITIAKSAILIVLDMVNGDLQTNVHGEGELILFDNATVTTPRMIADRTH